jgi:hypothetical protein
MSEQQRIKDQAEPLREHMSRMEKKQSLQEEGVLPSRKKVHRNRSKKKKKGVTVSFPLVQLLLMAFLLIVLLLVFSPYWLNL